MGTHLVPLEVGATGNIQVLARLSGECLMRRMNGDFVVFMCEHYPQVANEQFEFGTILTVEDKKEHENE